MYTVHGLGQLMLTETLWCLLGATLVIAQAQKLLLNSNSAFSPDNTPNPPIFTLPAAANLTISVALCSSGNALPKFFVTNSSTAGTPGSGGGKDVFEIGYTDGLGVWTGNFMNGGVLAVEDLGQTSFEVGISDQGRSM